MTNLANRITAIALAHDMLKHAFDGPGVIVVDFHAGAGIEESCLMVSNDGKGMGLEDRPGAMGASVVSSLAAQLRGRVVNEKPPHGTVTKIYFPPSGTPH